MANRMKGSNYWNGEGVYRKEFTELTEKLMKPCGRCDTLQGEVVRAANRLYYEYFNNGNCNAVNIEVRDDELYDYEEYHTIDGYYKNFLKIISDTVNTEECKTLCKDIEDFIENIGDNFGDEYVYMYDKLIDIVYLWAKDHEGGEIPNWYTNN